MGPSKKRIAADEVAVAKSAAQFFAENQTIAGFDNPGKSLFTTIRELVENALDACESIGTPPHVKVRVDEVSSQALDEMRGLEHLKARFDPQLFKPAGGEEAEKKGAVFRVSCADNGCGMSRLAIPDMMGRVLSGSKYGVRQTRGKFGLGAKMALVWAKKSTGLPIVVRSRREDSATGTKMVLDIDVAQNEPRVVEESIDEMDRGTEVIVTAGGAWSAYKARIMAYFQQLAIITPYADLEFAFGNKLSLYFRRRSEKIPDAPRRTGYHPSALNELLVQQLVERAKDKRLVAFLSAGEIAAIPKELATKLIAEYGDDTISLAPAKIAQLSRLLRQIKCKPPDASVLSPVGEYNLRLGVAKEINPTYVATHSSKASSYQGHPFLVEAAVSIGGGSHDGGDLTVHRFANRIPLLFEAGADVATRVAKTKIKWSSYNIDPKKDRVAVFVSLVSTKIPFKGTSKEYIGEDATEIRDAVKSCLQHCCQQLKVKLVQRDNDRRNRDREKQLLKYAPDAAHALFKVLDQLKNAQTDDPERFALRARLPPQLSQRFLLERLKHAVENIVGDRDDAAPEKGEDTCSHQLDSFDATRPLCLASPIYLKSDLLTIMLFETPNTLLREPALEKRKAYSIDDDDQHVSRRRKVCAVGKNKAVTDVTLFSDDDEDEIEIDDDDDEDDDDYVDT